MLQSTLYCGYLWTEQIVHQLTNRTSLTIVLLLTFLFAKVSTKFSTCCEIRIFIIYLLQSAIALYPYSETIESSPQSSYPFSSILIVSSIISVNLRKSIVLQVLRQNIYMHFYVPYPYEVSRLSHDRYIRLSECKQQLVGDIVCKVNLLLKSKHDSHDYS